MGQHRMAPEGDTCDCRSLPVCYGSSERQGRCGVDPAAEIDRFRVEEFEDIYEKIDEAGAAEGDVDTMSSTPEPEVSSPDAEEPEILEEIEVEDLAVDGICGVY